METCTLFLFLESMSLLLQPLQPNHSRLVLRLSHTSSFAIQVSAVASGPFCSVFFCAFLLPLFLIPPGAFCLARGRPGSSFGCAPSP